MPASRTYHSHDKGAISVDITGDLEPSRIPFRSKTVYFTDQSPTFECTITNHYDKRVDYAVWLYLSYHESENDYEKDQGETIEFDLEPGQSVTKEFSQDMLLHQGTASIVLRKFRIYKRHDEIQTNRKKDIYKMYTFMVYDRDYYRVNYLRPRYAQYIAAGLSVLIVAVGVIQISILLFS